MAFTQQQEDDLKAFLAERSTRTPRDILDLEHRKMRGETLAPADATRLANALAAREAAAATRIARSVAATATAQGED